jgi:hypothetical protein
MKGIESHIPFNQIPVDLSQTLIDPNRPEYNDDPRPVSPLYRRYDPPLNDERTHQRGLKAIQRLARKYGTNRN